mgnify:CR=1 FL=1
MKFGSRIDVFLPPSSRITVKVGDRVVSGETAIATLNRNDVRRGHAGPSSSRAARHDDGRGLRHGVSLLPSLFTIAQPVLRLGLRRLRDARASSTTAAPFIGVAIVLDMLDGRIARMTGTTERLRRAVRLAGRS